MKTTESSRGNFAARNIKNTRRLALWTGAWVGTMALVNFGYLFIWPEQQTVNIATIILNLLAGFGMINANRLQLKGLDELQQKIQLQAMGFTLGFGLVVGLTYSNLEITNLIRGDAEISYLVMMMGVTYVIATVVSQRRFG